MVCGLVWSGSCSNVCEKTKEVLKLAPSIHKSAALLGALNLVISSCSHRPGVRLLLYHDLGILCHQLGQQPLPLARLLLSELRVEGEAEAPHAVVHGLPVEAALGVAVLRVLRNKHWGDH